MKALQSFSEEYLSYARSLAPHQILRFLEEYRLLLSCRKLPQSQPRIIGLHERCAENALSDGFERKAAANCR